MRFEPSIALITVFLFGCVSTPKRPERPSVPICNNGRADHLLKATFYINHSVPAGTTLSDISQLIEHLNATAEFMIRNHFVFEYERGSLQSGETEYWPTVLVKVGPEQFVVTLGQKSGIRFVGVEDSLKDQHDFVFRTYEQNGELYEFSKEFYLLQGSSKSQKDLVAELIVKGTTRSKKVEGDVVVEEVTLNPNDLCKYARPRSDLYSR